MVSDPLGGIWRCLGSRFIAPVMVCIMAVLDKFYTYIIFTFSKCTHFFKMLGLITLKTYIICFRFCKQTHFVVV